MKKIGVLFGMENTFPGALVERINAMGLPDITAESVQVGGVREAAPSGYAVIVDRISHDIPFYRGFLKNAALTGTIVINNPFWWSADDKFFNYALARKLGVAVPHTVLLPHKQYPAGTTERSMRNLRVSARLGGHLRVRRLPCLPQALRRRRLARRLPCAQLGGVLPGLRPDRRSVHDAAERGEIQGVFPLLRGRSEEGPHHAVRSAASVSRALRQGSAGLSIPSCWTAWSATR